MPGYWRRFRDDARLSITFNRYPNTPGTPSLDPTSSAGSGPSGYLSRDSTPVLRAQVSDPDGGNVKGRFRIYHSGSVLLWEGLSGFVASGSTAQVTVGTTLSQGVLYTVRVFGHDGQLDSKAWSDYIQFKVDVTAPAEPVIEAQNVGTGIDAKYFEDAWAGGPGKVGKFRFKPNGVTDVDRYRYSFNSASYTFEVDADSAGVSVNLISYTPSAPGLHTLRVWTVDLAGWQGPPNVYAFFVNVAPKAAWWLLDGDGTDSAPGAAHPLTFVGTTSFVDGPLIGEFPNDRALHIAAASSGAGTSGPVVHTGGSYTVTALVNATSDGTANVAVSQDGVEASGFKLGIMANSSCAVELGSSCWGFWTASDDDANDPGWVFLAPQVDAGDPQHFAVQPGTWTALAGVYDAAAHELRLYVNGELAGTAAFTADWDAVGKVRIGHSAHNGTVQYTWFGDLDDVRVFRVALDEDTIRRISQGSRDAADLPQ